MGSCFHNGKSYTNISISKSLVLLKRRFSNGKCSPPIFKVLSFILKACIVTSTVLVFSNDNCNEELVKRKLKKWI